MLLHKASAESEARILAVVGLSIVLCVALVTVWFVADPLGGKDEGLYGLTIETPYVGEGVEPGTALMLHGVAVGEVTEVSSMRDGGVRMLTDIQREPTIGLTDAMKIDFRPANYFGVTGINISPGKGGQELADGQVVRVVPIGNFTLQALLQQLGEISHGVISPKLIDVIDRSTVYLDGLDPFLETMLVVANSLADVQNVPTATLLANATGISVAFPGFTNGAVATTDQFLHGGLDGVSEDYYQNTYSPTIELASTDLFGAAGTLLSTHSEDLAPLTGMIKILTDIAPGIIPPGEIDYAATELRTRLERLFSGPPDRRAVDVRVIVENMPGLAAPLAAMGALPQTGPAAEAAQSAGPVDQGALPANQSDTSTTQPSGGGR